MARKQRSIAALLIVSAVLVFIAYIVLIVILPNMLKPATQMWLGDGIFQTKLATDGDSRSKGLSGVSELRPDQALLMVYPADGKWGIWMKDMKVPLDIVWLDGDKRVVHRVKNVPASDERTFTPTKDARYVVELPAGTIDSKAISANSIAIFDIKTEDTK